MTARKAFDRLISKHAKPGLQTTRGHLDFSRMLTSDGRPMAARPRGYLIALALVEMDPIRYASDIVKLMKPFCVPFDTADVEAKTKRLARLAKSAPRQRPGAAVRRRTFQNGGLRRATS